MVSVGFGWLLLILGGCARASHTPGPSREGRFGRCFLVGSERFDGMVSPLERGDWDGTFLFVGEEFSVDVSLL